MRITLNSMIDPFLSNLNDIQVRQSKAQLRLESGQNIISIYDNPTAIGDVKFYNDIISRNENYKNNLDDAVNEMMSVSEVLTAASDSFQSIRDLAVQASTVGYKGNFSALSGTIKGILEDLVKDGNSDYKDRFLFPGTATTPQSITPTPPQTNNLPFEIIQNPTTTSNPSGLSVVFKGNNKDRIINKDSHSTETINAKAEELFGAGGTEIFDTIIKLYNVLGFNSDGTKKTSNDVLSKDDLAIVNDCQKKLGDFTEKFDAVASQFGSKINRLQALSTQMSEESTRLKEFRSKDADTDVAAASLDLAKQQNALQYALSVGSKLVQQSLLDFLR